MLCLSKMDIAVEGIIRGEVDFGRESPGDFSQQSLRIYLQVLPVQLGSCLAQVLDSGFIMTHMCLRTHACLRVHTFARKNRNMGYL